MRLETEEDIKLMIVGSLGWRCDKTVALIKSFVSSGDLLHLEKVDQVELPYLYSSANCFVYAAFMEGFGLPATEAMQCGCPVAVSDIAAHRYSANDAALYFDPYDSEDIANKLKLLISDDGEKMRNDLIQKGYKNVKRFSMEQVVPQWESVFEKLSHKSLKD
jgi:glycosyltransferase involved in cell wall biosynthesis